MLKYQQFTRRRLSFLCSAASWAGLCSERSFS